MGGGGRILKLAVASKGNDMDEEERLTTDLGNS